METENLIPTYKFAFTDKTNVPSEAEIKRWFKHSPQLTELILKRRAVILAKGTN